MKRLTVVLVVLVILASTSSAFAGTKEFSKSSFFLTPQVGVNTYAVPFGISAEYGVTPNIGAGGTVMFWIWGDVYWTNSLIAFSADAAYHVTQLNVKKLDLFGGASIGYSIYSWKWKSGYGDWLEPATATSGLYLSPFVGARYYFSSKFAASAKSYFSILGSWRGVGGVLGITIRLK